MVSEYEVFEVEFTEECIEEMAEIYDYISVELKGDKAARRFWKEENIYFSYDLWKKKLLKLIIVYKI